MVLFWLSTVPFVVLAVLFALATQIQSAEGAMELIGPRLFLVPIYVTVSIISLLWYIAMKPKESKRYALPHGLGVLAASLLWGYYIFTA